MEDWVPSFSEGMLLGQSFVQRWWEDQSHYIVAPAVELAFVVEGSLMSAQLGQHLLHQLALRVVALLLLFDIKNVFFSFSSKGKQHPYIIVIDEHRRLTAGVIMSSSTLDDPYSIC